MELTLPEKCCGVCLQHNDSVGQERFEISRNGLWVLRHHPNPAPRVGWLLLDGNLGLVLLGLSCIECCNGPLHRHLVSIAAIRSFPGLLTLFANFSELCFRLADSCLLTAQVKRWKMCNTLSLSIRQN